MSVVGEALADMVKNRALPDEMKLPTLTLGDVREYATHLMNSGDVKRLERGEQILLKHVRSTAPSTEEWSG